MFNSGNLGFGGLLEHELIDHVKHMLLSEVRYHHIILIRVLKRINQHRYVLLYIHFSKLFQLLRDKELIQSLEALNYCNF